MRDVGEEQSMRLRRWVAMFLLLMGLGGLYSTGWAQEDHGEGENMEEKIQKSLAEAGIRVSEDEVAAARKDMEEQAEWMKSDMPEEIWRTLAGRYQSEEQWIQTVLLNAGMGKWDEGTGEWSPTSQDVYAFDAEVMDIERMYTHFLRGVQAIAADVTLSNIQEDLSQVTDEMANLDNPSLPSTNGKRSVSFELNGHAYEVELESYGDWINMEIVNFVNQALEKEGASGRLYVVGHGMDQMVIMIYGSKDKAEALSELLDME